MVVFLLLTALDAGDDIPDRRRGELVLLFVAVVVVGTVIAVFVLTRRVRPMIGALERGEALEGEARASLFAAPWENAAMSGAMWVGAAVVFGAHSAVRLDTTAGESASLAAIVVLGGLVTGGAVYLVLERALRPVFVLAFSHQAPDRVRGVAVRPRLLLAWFVSSAVPLVIVALVAVDVEDIEELPQRLLPWVGVGLAAGLVVTAAAARSVAEPLASLRQATRAVREADFSVRAPVDDATEVGLLQAGFNEMVVGLEERERLRDLFGRHVGAGVARRALERGVELGGEHVEASALFVDLVGSTALAAHHPPGRVVAMLNELFAVVIEAVEGNGGWVNKFEGDAALCVFGPPVGDTDHAARALQAARQMRAGLDALTDRHPDLVVGVGVSTGRVVAGNIGSEQRYEYTVIGDTVNEASRLTDLAKDRPGLLLASGRAVTGAGSGEARHWHQVGEERLRGRSVATELWEPRGSPSVSQ